MLKECKTKEYPNEFQQMEGMRKMGGPCKRWRDKVEMDINYGTNKRGRQWPGIVWNGGRVYWEPKSTTDCRA